MEVNITPIPELLEALLRMMYTNRKRYGKHWTAVRVDRLTQCFDPFLTDDQVAQVVKLGITQDVLKPVMKHVRDSSEEVPGVELVDY